jgi:hypothetical protein
MASPNRLALPLPARGASTREYEDYALGLIAAAALSESEADERAGQLTPRSEVMKDGHRERPWSSFV